MNDNDDSGGGRGKIHEMQVNNVPEGMDQWHRCRLALNRPQFCESGNYLGIKLIHKFRFIQSEVAPEILHIYEVPN